MKRLCRGAHFEVQCLLCPAGLSHRHHCLLAAEARVELGHPDTHAFSMFRGAETCLTSMSTPSRTSRLSTCPLSCRSVLYPSPDSTCLGPPDRPLFRAVDSCGMLEKEELVSALQSCCADTLCAICHEEYQPRSTTGRDACDGDAGCSVDAFTDDDGSGTGSTLRVLPCKHSFHLECIDRWAYSVACQQRSPACPLCNAHMMS